MVGLTIDQALQQGVEAHKAGQVQKADRLYTAILKAQPDHPDANHNLGVLAVGVGKVEQALPFFKTALEAHPATAQFWLSYIGTLIKLDKLTDAQAVLDQAKAKGASGDAFAHLEQRLDKAKRITANAVFGKQDPPKDQQQSLINLYDQGRLKQAQKLVEDLLQQFPKSSFLYNVSGAVYKRIGLLDLSVEAYIKALKIKPGDTDAYNNMGITLREQGKLQEAIEAYQKVLEIKPNNADAHNNMGVTLRDQGKLDRAVAAYKKAIEIRPDHADAYNNMGITLKDQGEFEQAIEAYKQALAIKPDYAVAYNNMGNVRTEQGKLEEAIEAYTKALTIQPDYAGAYNNMGVTLRDQGKLEEAIEAYNKAIKINPTHADAYNNMGIALQEAGKLEEAQNSYRKAIFIEPDHAEAHRHLSRMIRYKPDDPQITEVKKLINRLDLKDSDRCHLLYTYAKINEDCGYFKAAYSNYVEGGALRRKLLDYKKEKDRWLFAKIKKTAPSLISFEFTKSKQAISPMPIFVVGMPRSGTTLVEQIISCHSQVHGAGELPFAGKFGGPIVAGLEPITTKSLSDFRKSYLAELEKISHNKRFITDKMPQNFQYIGLILKVFPGAKIIHVKRDPAATCWSNFKHYFTGRGLGYSYDLEDTIRYFDLYKDLMNRWDELYGDQIYHLDYEKLTVDQECETKKLIKNLELCWEDACLSPHKNKRGVKTASQQQVRKKVYTGSSQAWRKFGPYLDGVLDAL